MNRGMILERAQYFQRLRQTHSAWRLLASRRAPLILACFEQLFRESAEVSLEDGVQHLGDLFLEFQNDEELALRGDDVYAEARREVRDWIRRRLLVERGGRLSATDALQRTIQFAQNLEEQLMTSTASRLRTVQDVIERLLVQLHPDQETHIRHLEQKIKELEGELERAKQGELPEVDSSTVVEELKEVYQQSMSLKADFRRVEDSYRAADYQLRKEITKADKDRGQVIDTLLESHESLLKTPEGQVFDAFCHQLYERGRLEKMKAGIQDLLQHEDTPEAYNAKQRDDMRDLIHVLVTDSSRVIDAKSRGEQDVKSYVKTGLASENFRVGALINELTEAAYAIDWEDRKVARQPAALPPINIPVTNLPLIQRLLPKQSSETKRSALDLQEQGGDVIDLDENFWASYESLDRAALFSDTLAFLEQRWKPATLADLAQIAPKKHDLESVAYWITLAREAGTTLDLDKEEHFTIEAEGEPATAFTTPHVELTADALRKINRETLD